MTDPALADLLRAAQDVVASWDSTTSDPRHPTHLHVCVDPKAWTRFCALVEGDVPRD